MSVPSPRTPPPNPDPEAQAALERTLFDEAIALALDGAAEEAVAVLREAPHGPDSPEWILGLARARIARDAAGDRAQAREALRALAEAGGEHAWRAWLQLARDARREGRIDAAAGMLKAALDAFRSTPAGKGAGAEMLADLLSREVRHLRARSADATTRGENDESRRPLDASALLRIVEFGKRAATITEPQEVLALVLEEAIALTAMERGFIVLVDGERLELALARGIDIEHADPDAREFAVSRTLVREVVKTGRPAYIEEPAEVGGHPAGASLTDRGVRAVACVPITSAGTLCGVLYVDHRTRARQLDGATAHLLELFAGQAAVALENARAHAARRRALETAQEALRLRREASDRSSDFEPLVGRSPAMEDLFLRLERILPTEAPVLIRGETGTGKDLVAQIVHRRGPRGHGEYVAFNCAGFPESLLEDQLFGHERGAFTGAVQPHAGLFEVANRGTLFLDEVGDMSPRMQSALLRVLESGEVRRLGGRDAIEVDVRILAATHRDLEAMVLERTEELRDAMAEREEAHRQLLEALVQALDAREQDTHNHSIRVAAYTAAMARELGLREPELSEIYRGALLHDIGKIGVPEQVLRKPDRLTPEERTLVKSHAPVGAEIVEGIEFLRAAEPGIRHHHERWDGGGYPDGLRGEAIPLVARIVNAADTWDACTSERPYQRAYSAPEVLAILADLRGAQIDPAVHDAILRALARRGDEAGGAA
jgi:putative nucleotidyltransferase with HDIG domain